MKGDFTRFTFRKTEHYDGVRLQQGRVHLDADWNEQVDIQAHRDRTTGSDLIGPCGAPLHDAGFALTCSTGDILVDGCSSGGLRVGAGRYYVDGILCENEDDVDLDDQPDLTEALPSESGLYLAYLDVWHRHLTALERPDLREVALGGPDTATRTRTIWQVKLHRVGDTGAAADCSDDFPSWTALTTPGSGRLRARGEPAEPVDGPCIVPPGAGYRRLENQLYRVEVHDGGRPYTWPRPGGIVATTVEDITLPDSVRVAADGRAWRSGQYVEVFSDETDAANGAGTLARVVAVNLATRVLTLDADLSALATHTNRRARPVASFKWSRDNGSVAARLEDIQESTLITSPMVKDPLLGFSAGQWVELSDEERALRAEPGILVELGAPREELLPVTGWPNDLPLTMADFGTGPIARRWDSPGVVPVTVSETAEWLDLEDGVQVAFATGDYRGGDYWTIPARTLTGSVEWPQDGADPRLEPPHGIRHHYCALGLLDFDGTSWKLTGDCREFFPPATEVSPLEYVSGDGQEAMPDLTQPALLVPLARPLEVGVANWVGATVRFEITHGNGRLEGTDNFVEVLTGPDGIASCAWELDGTTLNQRVEAHLLGENGQPIPLPVRFNANLSVASQVAYDPKTCGALNGMTNVQDAVDRLSQLTRLFYVGGDGQEARPGQPLRQLLQVQVANDCGPVAGAQVRFETQSNGRVAANIAGLAGSSQNSIAITTGTDGVASCAWRLDANLTSPSQQLVATLTGAGDNPIHAPATRRFTANHSLAAEVAYDPSRCPDLSAAGADTVQAAIDELCRRGGGGGGCEITVGKGGQFENLKEAIEALRDQEEICICLLTGDHQLEGGLEISGLADTRLRQLKISGCGGGTRLTLVGAPLVLRGLASFSLREVHVYASEMRNAIECDRCGEITIEACQIDYRGESDQDVLLSIQRASRVVVRDSMLLAYLPTALERPRPTLEPLQDAVRLFDILDPGEFRLFALELSQRLAQLPIGQRRAHARNILAVLNQSDRQLNDRERESFQRLAARLLLERPTPQLFADDFLNIRFAAALEAPGTAIVMHDGDADALLDANNIGGIVSLYGQPGPTRLTQGDAEKLRSMRRLNRIRSVPSTGSLNARNNRLSRLVVSEVMTRRLRESSANQELVLDSIFRQAALTDNAIDGGDNAFVSRHLSLTSSAFGPIGGFDVGIAVVDSAIYTANHAGNPDRVLSNIARSSAQAANLDITIT